MIQLAGWPLKAPYTDGTLPAPGWLGFGLIMALGVALVFLIRSMNKQLRKVPPSFDEPEPGAPPSDRTPPPA
jgi:hypothetical protein